LQNRHRRRLGRQRRRSAITGWPASGCSPDPTRRRSASRTCAEATTDHPDRAVPAGRGSTLGACQPPLLVLAVAAWILLKIVIGFVTAMATVIVVVLAIIGIVWAIRVL
jgi:hypothetical protein